MQSLGQDDFYKNLVQLFQNREYSSVAKLCNETRQKISGNRDLILIAALSNRYTTQVEQATMWFNKGLELYPNDLEMLVNFGNFFLAINNFDLAIEKYLRAININPNFQSARYNLGVAYQKQGKLAEAAGTYQLILKQEKNLVKVWENLLSVLIQLERHEEVKKLIESALLEPMPDDAFWCQSAHYYHTQHKFDKAEDAYERALKISPASQKTHFALIEYYLNRGDLFKAKEASNNALVVLPGNPELYRKIAEISWQLDEETDIKKIFSPAIKSSQDKIHAYSVMFDLLSSQRKFSQICDEYSQLSSEFKKSLPLQYSYAVSLSALNDTQQADQMFSQVLASDPNAVVPRLGFAEHLLKTERAAQSLAHFEVILSKEPYNQKALAFYCTALELLNDPMSESIISYDKMIKDIELYSESERDELNELQNALLKIHNTKNHPLEQSVRGGTQSLGFLFNTPSEALDNLKQRLTKALEEYCQEHPYIENHPFWSRNTNRIKITGAWSVFLRSQGFHTNHIHNLGWISSALYVKLPPEIESDSRAGHIQFGTPPPEAGISVLPKKIIKPREGHLVIFPSYMWHGTIPFDSEAFRLTAAFDFLPK